MKVRAYLDLSKFEVTHESNIVYNVDIKVGKTTVQQKVYLENGRFFIMLDEIDPFIPKDFGKVVISVTSRETLNSQHNQRPIKPGIYQDDQGSEAEVVFCYDLERLIGRRIDVRAKTIQLWHDFRHQVLSRKAELVHPFPNEKPFRIRKSRKTAPVPPTT